MEQKTILIVEDDESLRRVLEFNLEEVGYRVLTASTGESGLETFRTERPPLVITDIQMPGISGIEVLKAIKKETPETLVIVITAYGSVEKAVEAMKLGAYDYLTKPFGRDELRLTVDKALSYRDLQEENARLRTELSDQVDFSSIIGISEAMQQVFGMVRRVAATEASVLILGESGTGKELVARAIHYGSERRAGPFVPVNCAAIPSELLESELFGHVRGAFTGAIKERKGKFELADGGTLFLDEVGELALELQPKLLRALQEREIEPVGGTPRKVDVRVVTATNRDIEEEVGKGRFRDDLYYRLAVIPIYLPALHERKEDIPLLVRHFVTKYAGPEIKINDALFARMQAYPWPGNVRELENAVERMLILRRGDTLEVEDFKMRSVQRVKGKDRVLNLPLEGYPLEDIEKEAVLEALHRSGGNQTRAAEFLRIPRHTLIYRIEKYGLKKT